MAKDLLFATLDPTMRSVNLINSGRKIILSDTVGFISHLPTHLVAAFRATLEEVLEADLVIHVRDISHPDTSEQKKDVESILKSLGMKESVPIIEVHNKIDQLDQRIQITPKQHSFPEVQFSGNHKAGALQYWGMLIALILNEHGGKA